MVVRSDDPIRRKGSTIAMERQLRWELCRRHALTEVASGSFLLAWRSSLVCLRDEGIFEWQPSEKVLGGTATL